MQNIAAIGRFFGWVGMVLGLAMIGIGLLASPADNAVREFERCQIDRQLGRRAAPCPPPDGTDRVVLLAAGGSSFASGLFFLLLASILTVLIETQEAHAADRRRREDAAQAAARGAPPAPTHGGPRTYVHPTTPAPATRRAIPTRFEMQQRYGEALGNRAWAMLEKYAREGDPLTEQDAVEAARAEIRTAQS